MTEGVHVRYTRLLRTSHLDLWQRLRELLKDQGLDPATTVLVDLFPDGRDREFGQVITDEGRVYRFDLCYERDRRRSARKAALDQWTDITGSWQTEPLQARTMDAFIWVPPTVRTHLTMPAPNFSTSPSQESFAPARDDLMHPHDGVCCAAD